MTADDGYLNDWDRQPHINEANHAQWFEEFLPVFEPRMKALDFETVLDAGCGEGQAYPMFNGLGKKYLGVDITLFAVQRAMERYPKAAFQHGNVIDLVNFTDESFDLVFCKSCIVHLEKSDLVKALKSVYRVAKRWLVVSFYILPTKAGKRWAVSKDSLGFLYTATSMSHAFRLLESLRPRPVEVGSDPIVVRNCEVGGMKFDHTTFIVEKRRT